MFEISIWVKNNKNIKKTSTCARGGKFFSSYKQNMCEHNSLSWWQSDLKKISWSTKKVKTNAGSLDLDKKIKNIFFSKNAC